MKILAAEHLQAASGPAEFPPPRLPELAFLGRSNVGKSSLLNRLVRRRQLARTSGTPGKTRLVHFYRVALPGRELCFVDLPGYGFARVARGERKRWKLLVEAYLARGPALRAAVLLQDLRRDPGEDEALLVEWLEARGIPVILALTKCDKEKPMRRAARLRELAAALPVAPERVVATSAETGLGIDELWRALGTLLDRPTERGGVTPRVR
jgi:GTP-binding protein